jgi:hypothetical protein
MAEELGLKLINSLRSQHHTDSVVDTDSLEGRGNHEQESVLAHG